MLGSRSIDLIYGRNLNEPTPSTTPFTTALFPNQLFSGINYYDNGGSDVYNALELMVQKRFGKNLTFNSGFTWAKDLTDAQDTGGGGGSFAGQTLQNQFCRTCERSNNRSFRRAAFYAYAVYSLTCGDGPARPIECAWACPDAVGRLADQLDRRFAERPVFHAQLLDLRSIEYRRDRRRPGSHPGSSLVPIVTDSQQLVQSRGICNSGLSAINARLRQSGEHRKIWNLGLELSRRVLPCGTWISASQRISSSMSVPRYALR